MTTLIRMAGITLATEARPAELIDFADLMLQAAQRGLHAETAGGVIYEDHDRHALTVLIDGARDAIRGAVRQEQCR